MTAMYMLNTFMSKGKSLQSFGPVIFMSVKG